MRRKCVTAGRAAAPGTLPHQRRPQRGGGGLRQHRTARARMPAVAAALAAGAPWGRAPRRRGSGLRGPAARRAERRRSARRSARRRQRREWLDKLWSQDTSFTSFGRRTWACAAAARAPPGTHSAGRPRVRAQPGRSRTRGAASRRAAQPRSAARARKNKIKHLTLARPPPTQPHSHSHAHVRHAAGRSEPREHELPVLTGHVSSFPPYQADTSRPSPRPEAEVNAQSPASTSSLYRLHCCGPPAPARRQFFALRFATVCH